ncbi:MAG TPA: tetratricopeptide repeat protein [Burkholderiaceae bacterium]|nr:tetratricopeptide repeat protein [Burkholderiaceae bacterium]
MPAFKSRSGAVRALVVLLASLAFVQVAPAQATPDETKPEKTEKAEKGEAVENSRLDRQLFYQLLIGEIQLRDGEAGEAYQIILDAARRNPDDVLFRRATDIAVQARAGDQALQAVRAWRQTMPESLEALRYQIQLLIVLNRAGETLEPLQALLRLTPAPQRLALITSLPRSYARAADRAGSATLIEQALQGFVDAPETRVVARVAVGRAWLAAGDTTKALTQAQRAHELDPANEAPAALALEFPSTPNPQSNPQGNGDAAKAAEAIVLNHLKVKPDSNGVRLLYVRSLLNAQRYADAAPQLETLTRNAPDMAQAWLTLGALHLQLREPAPATAALQKYIALVQAQGPAAKSDSGDDEDDLPQTQDDALARGWLLLSQAAEQQGDLRGAEAWLAKIDSPQRVLEVQARRASLLAREGKIAQARELIRRVPEKTPADARAKLMAEAQVMRDAKQWGEAAKVLAVANQKYPDDVDLLYEQSMMYEKLNKLDEMEKLLRRVIALKPDHQHAYNALGYSLAERNVRLPEARGLIKKALELSPGEPSITDSLGWVEYRLGNHAEAVRLLRDAYRSQPDAEIAAHLGEVLWVTGQTDEAKRVWREGRGRDAGNDVLRETLARLRVDL